MNTPGPWGAVVLAAGRASRMGAFKPLLKVCGRPALDHIMASLAQAGAEAVVVVGGAEARRLRPHVKGPWARLAVNPRPELGMFSSLRVGLAALPPGLRAFFVWPVDAPLVRAATLQQMLEYLPADALAALTPTHGGRRGHPPLLAAGHIPRLLAADQPEGLRGYLRTLDPGPGLLAVADPAVLQDLDTPADLAAWAAAGHIKV